MSNHKRPWRPRESKHWKKFKTKPWYGAPKPELPPDPLPPDPIEA